MLDFILTFIQNIIKTIIDYSFEFYSRIFLRNNINKEIIDIIKEAQKKYNKKDLIIEDVNDVKFYKKTKELKTFLIEVFLLENNSEKRNDIENLYLIKGYKINNKIHIIYFSKKNSDDLGEIVPQNTNKYHF